MTPEQKVEAIMDYCREILKAKGKKRIGAWRKYLWKIEQMAKCLRLCLESGDITEDKL